jgi:multisubunit Na+/H+ antiporter MnhF subunit
MQIAFHEHMTVLRVTGGPTIIDNLKIFSSIKKIIFLITLLYIQKL